MDPFATIEELIARCDWTFDDGETRAAPGYLEEASDLARAYGRPGWTPDNVPRMVKNIVIGAVRRFMRNPEGYTQSRAGDESLSWRDAGEDTASIVFTKAEIKLIRGLAGAGGLISAQVVAWGSTYQGPDAGYVPVQGYTGEKAFPYYELTDSPWSAEDLEPQPNYVESPFPHFVDPEIG